MIEVRGLVKSYGSFRALDGLDASVPDGAVYGLVGPNGAGKSTLIRHLAGIYRQDAGTVLIGGEQVYENPAVKGRIAYIPDEVFYYGQASAMDMMRFYRDMYPRFDRQRFDALGELFCLDPKCPIRRLSKGMQKQAAFWLALSARPEILILDEPVDGLDPVMRRQVWRELMHDVSENGTTVLISSHNLRELEDVCDHVGIMKGGRMLLEKGLDELQDELVKVQLAFADGGALPDGLDILHSSSMGRLQQLVLRGNADEIRERLAAANPLFVDTVPLTLEEIFIYELGGADDEIKDIVL